MTFVELLEAAGVVPDALVGNAEVTDITPDSRHAGPGSLFVCMPSLSQDSHQYVFAAAERGAVAILAHSLEGFKLAAGQARAIAWIHEDRFQDALWRIAKAFYQNPTTSMKVIGVTGTNGKTTTAWLIRQMLAGDSAYLGTLGFFLKDKEIPVANTTPFSLDLNRMLAQARESGITSLAMEVSSHALEQKRAHGLEFDAAVFTNLTQDHLDFHGTMEAYANAKRRLFTEIPRESNKEFTAALNTDDPTGAQWAREMKGRVITYGFQSGDLRGEALEVQVDRLTMKLSYQGASCVAGASLGGTFNLWNCLSAVAGMVALGFPLEEAVQRLSGAAPAPGRFEAVPNHAGMTILIDYAHTPDALVKLLQAVRALPVGRIIAVFGCGGDRDRTKRPLMARAACEGADIVVATSDNPRTEDPYAILNEIYTGLLPGVESYLIVDRQEAITKAISLARPGDVVVIAGKGHENYQLIGREKTPFDDRVAALEALDALSNIS